MRPACARCPAAGARHPFETYLSIAAVEGLKPGIYRYMSMEHELALIKEHDAEELREEMRAGLPQPAAGQTGGGYVHVDGRALPH